jgi:hypothetical protein
LRSIFTMKVITVLVVVCIVILEALALKTLPSASRLRLNHAIMMVSSDPSGSPPTGDAKSDSSRIGASFKVASIATLGAFAFAQRASAANNNFAQWDRTFGTVPIAGTKQSKVARPVLYGVEKTDPPSLLPRSSRAIDSTARLLAGAEVVVLSHHPVNGTSSSFSSSDSDSFYTGGVTGATTTEHTDECSSRDHALQAAILLRLLSQGGRKRLSTSRSSGGRPTADDPTNWCVGMSGLRASAEASDALMAYLNSDSGGSEDVARLAAALRGHWSAEEIIDDSGGTSLKASTALVEAFLPILSVARAYGLPVIPLALPDSVVSRVATSGGLDAITDEEKERFVLDVTGYAAGLSSPTSTRYANRVIPERLTELNRHESQWSSSTGQQPSGSYQARDVYAAMTLRDEACASLVARRRQRSGEKAGGRPGPMVLLTTVNRARFGCGLSDRVQRNLEFVRSTRTGAGAGAGTGAGASSSGSSAKSTYTVLLNPTTSDSLASTSQMQLILGYGSDLADNNVIADYLWFSKAPPAKLLPRVKNAVNREGDRPPGESSVIGAFGARSGNMSTNKEQEK